MIHRYIHDILTAGVTAIQNDITLLEDLFDENYDIETTETVSIRAYFETKGFNVINGYARADTEFPAVSIILASEEEVENFLANSAGQITDTDDPDFGADIESAIWNHAYNLHVYTEHPDVTAYYYELTKLILLAGLSTLTDKGCFGYRFAGQELAPDPKYIPDHLFGRQLVFQCQREFQNVDKASKLQKAWAVSGIHIDSSGSPSDVGGVKTLVTPYTEE